MLATPSSQDGSMSLQKQKREYFSLWEFWPEQVHSAGETLARRLTVQETQNRRTLPADLDKP